MRPLSHVRLQRADRDDEDPVDAVVQFVDLRPSGRDRARSSSCPVGRYPAASPCARSRDAARTPAPNPGTPQVSRHRGGRDEGDHPVQAGCVDRENRRDQDGRHDIERQAYATSLAIREAGAGDRGSQKTREDGHRVEPDQSLLPSAGRHQNRGGDQHQSDAPLWYEKTVDATESAWHQTWAVLADGRECLEDARPREIRGRGGRQQQQE